MNLETFLKVTHGGISYICEEKEFDKSMLEGDEDYEIKLVQMICEEYEKLEEFSGF